MVQFITSNLLFIYLFKNILVFHNYLIDGEPPSIPHSSGKRDKAKQITLGDILKEYNGQKSITGGKRLVYFLFYLYLSDNHKESQILF